MEEQVGELWHKLITRVADNQYPAAAVFLHDIQQAIGIYFRALGGDGGLQIEVADATDNLSRRSLLQRIAGSHSKVQLAWRDERSLKLPQSIAWFDSAELNTDLYYWLACLAAVQPTDIDSNHTTLASQKDWFYDNQKMTLAAFNKFPGIRSRYLRLLQAHLHQRPVTGRLSTREASVELAIQHALTRPGEIDTLPSDRLPPQPVPLWLHPEPPFTASSSAHDDDDDTQANSSQSRELDDIGHRQAERVEDPEADRGLITVRMENIFSMGEFVNVDRGSEDEDDADRAEDVARELDKLSVTNNGQASKTRLKFDLDLPSAASDDVILDDGILLPEWDWKKQQLLPDRRCRPRMRSTVPCQHI